MSIRPTLPAELAAADVSCMHAAACTEASALHAVSLDHGSCRPPAQTGLTPHVQSVQARLPEPI